MTCRSIRLAILTARHCVKLSNRCKNGGARRALTNGFSISVGIGSISTAFTAAMLNIQIWQSGGVVSWTPKWGACPSPNFLKRRLALAPLPRANFENTKPIRIMETDTNTKEGSDCSAASCPGKNVLTLKWGTVKGWHLATDEAKAALQKWADGGVSRSAAMQKDSPEQKEALLAAMDHIDEFWLDWEDKQVTREEAKEYVRTYGRNA